jgi:hypothetical protein
MKILSKPLMVSLAVALVSCLTLIPAESQRRPRIALILPDSISDMSWNAGAYKGLMEVKEKVTQLSREYGFKVDGRAKVQDLAVGAQQKVEIMKALYRHRPLGRAYTGKLFSNFRTQWLLRRKPYGLNPVYIGEKRAKLP